MKNKQTVVFAIGRWMPIHLGHKEFLVKLAKSFDKLIIGIGSCYENGTPRNCIPAIEREKLLRKMLKTEGIENTEIIPVQDRPTFDEWIDDVCAVCQRYGVTHFCTGNKEDILDVLEQKGITLDVEMINPEVGSSFPFHATDIRNAIIRGEDKKLDSMIPSEIKDIVLRQIAKEIRMANLGMGQEFIPGRQTVDLVFTVKNKKDGKNYILLGKRNMGKIDFPGVWAIPGSGIEEFESPIVAAVRSFLAETGIELLVEDNSDEPAVVICQNLGKIKAELHFVGIYASSDERINGTRGGGSQCFAMNIEGDIHQIGKVLFSKHDMDALEFVDVDLIHGMTLAFDQKNMVYHAFGRLGIPYDNGELLAVMNEDGRPTGDGVSREDAHKTGVLHGASHIYICKRVDGDLFFLLQRRSGGKDSFPGCLDISSAGHIEKGSDFLETATKELNEELGITVLPDELTELFTQTVDITSEFRGKAFVDREINKIYLLEKDVCISELNLQITEVSEVVWRSVDDIVAALESNDEEYCLNTQEFYRVVECVKGLE